MHRPPLLDLVYTHEMVPVPVHPASTAPACSEARDLVARLRCLKVLMDVESDARLGPCLLALRAFAPRKRLSGRYRTQH